MKRSVSSIINILVRRICIMVLIREKKRLTDSGERNMMTFMLEEEAKVLAEEYVHENESSLLSIFFKA